MTKEDEQIKVTNYALNLISYRKRSEMEILNALDKKGFNKEYITYTIDYLKENKYINDEDFAKSFIADKQNLNKYGPNKIKYELYKKGISKEIVELSLIPDDELEYEMALELALKKIETYVDQDRNNIYRKLGGMLQRKGYSYDIIIRVLDFLLNN